MNTAFKRAAVMSLTAVLVLAGAVFCSGMDEQQRLAIIKGLKLKGIVGENNKGLVEFVGADRSAQAVVDEENAARKKAYGEIAAKSGASPDKVGEQRAAQIAGGEQEGVMIQAPSGKWRKK